MRWMALGLIPLILCGAMCFGGIVLAALGLRHVTDRSPDRSWDVAPERDDTHSPV